MNLLQIRQKFRDLSGRFDLVNEDGSDSGADFFINEGRKYLDRLEETQKSWGSVYKRLPPNHIGVVIPLSRAIKEVWVTTATARWRLDKKPLDYMMSTFLPGSVQEPGTPLYYAPIITRYVPENITIDDFGSYAMFAEIPFNSHEYNAIILNVANSAELFVAVHGLFYSAELVNNTDENHWAVTNPLLLIMAAMRQVEVVNRNTQGVNDWDTAIRAESMQLGMDLVEEQIADINVMEG